MVSNHDQRYADAARLANEGFAYKDQYSRLVMTALQQMARAGASGRVDFVPPPDAVTALTLARDRYLAALRILPKDITHDLAVIHHQLGGIFKDLGPADNAFYHLQQAVRLHESLGHRVQAGQSHQDLANTYIHRRQDWATALAHSRAAEAHFRAGGATALFQAAQRLTMEIQQRLGR